MTGREPSGWLRPAEPFTIMDGWDDEDKRTPSQREEDKWYEGKCQP